MIDGTAYWWLLLGLVALGWIILAHFDPFIKK
jgi:hypothetical protein